MDTDFLQKTMLFRNMTDGEIQQALKCLGAKEKAFGKGEVILSAGSQTDSMGLVLEGKVTMESNDVWGNRSIIGQAAGGQFFAETYALLPGKPLLVDVVAEEPSRILFLVTRRVAGEDFGLQQWSEKLLRNLLLISSHKNLALAERSYHTASKTIRGRVMSYLYSVSLRENSMEFDISFDRQELADYLNLERSALSKELGRMQREGILVTHKNHFVLCEDPGLLSSHPSSPHR